MRYFDPVAHRDYVQPPKWRNSEELANIAIEAEDDVISHYSGVSGDLGGYLIDGNLGLRVFLLGYRDDAADPTVSPRFVEAMRRTIALVIAWRLAQNEKEHGVKSVQKGGDRSATRTEYTAGAWDSFPNNWQRYLRPYDVRPKSGII